MSHFIHGFSWLDNAIHLQELTNKTGNYRKKLDYSRELMSQLKIEKRRFPDTNDIIALLHSTRFNQLQLSLLSLFLARQHEEKSTHDDHLDDELTMLNFAREKIEASLHEVMQEMGDLISLSSEQYIAQSKLLSRSLFTGAWLAGLFDNDLRDKFRRPWLDLQQGISELQSLWIIQQQLEKLASPPEKLVKWQHSKVDSLLTALDNTKAIAVSMTPYWQK